ncbi:MAG TPA: ribonuclease BN, partial [Cyanobacteria bacterium UBA11368]|nr:ribonuclease BN [Cyanobacteria bacterium UBA11368]
KLAFQRAGEQRLPGLAAEMAYNAMLSLFPTILAILTAIGLFASLRFTVRDIAYQVSQVAPQEALFLIQGFVQTVSRSHNEGLFSLSFIVALWTASAAQSAAMAALDEIHQIPLQQRRPFWKAKLVSIGLTIGTILLLIVAAFLMFISDLIVQVVASQSGNLQSGLLKLWRLLTWPAGLAIIASAFAFVYRYGPSRWNKGSPILPGAILAAISWAILSSLFRLYVTNFGNYNAAYGTVGTFIVLMLWLNLSSLVMLFGGQLNVTVGESMRKKG